MPVAVVRLAPKMVAISPGRRLPARRLAERSWRRWSARCCDRRRTEIFRIRWLLPSATYRLLAESTARPRGPYSRGIESRAAVAGVSISRSPGLCGDCSVRRHLPDVLRMILGNIQISAGIKRHPRSDLRDWRRWLGRRRPNRRLFVPSNGRDDAVRRHHAHALAAIGRSRFHCRRCKSSRRFPARARSG